MAPTVNLLLVDDDEVDVQGLKRAFIKSRQQKGQHHRNWMFP